MRTKKTVVILISGKAGSGKNVVADFLSSKLNSLGLSVMRYGFADPLKYIAKAFIGWDGEKDEKGRRLLQEQGRIGRDYDQDIWVKHFLTQLDRRTETLPFHFAIIHDWRFPNELAYLQKNPLLDIVTIRVFGRGGLNGETALDVSENSLPEATSEKLGAEDNQDPYNFCIENIAEIELLDHKLDIILAELKKQFITE